MVSRELPMAGGQSVDPGTGVTLLAFVLDGVSVRHDSGALHGRSREETDIVFSENPDAARNGRPVTIVWVGVRAGIDGRDGYFSAVASTQRIDAEAGTGYRPSTHFTDMIKAIQGENAIGLLSSDAKTALARAMVEHSAELWANRSALLKDLHAEQ
ncbi:MAG TPA: hypothetical protein ENN56_04025 [Firmicutes bacterium]|nr:hypothetical protein [Bacillota bacterium]